LFFGAGVVCGAERFAVDDEVAFEIAEDIDISLVIGRDGFDLALDEFFVFGSLIALDGFDGNVASAIVACGVCPTAGAATVSTVLCICAYRNTLAIAIDGFGGAPTGAVLADGTGTAFVVARATMVD
jgi:hypothetical protein